jgi:hypothetical protein
VVFHGLSASRLASVPLAARLSLETNVPTQIKLSFSDGTSQRTELAEREFKTIHTDLPVLGMRAGRTHEIRVTLRDQNGRETTLPEPILFTTPELPTHIPSVALTARDPDAMEPGVTFFSTLAIGSTGAGYLIAVDDEGEVIWYLDGTKHPLTAGHGLFASHLPNGNLLVLAPPHKAMEMDMLGEVVQVWYANGIGDDPPTGATLVDVDSFHHEMLPLPESEDADFVVLGTESREFPNYPADETDSSLLNPTGVVIGDTIVEFKRDGTIVRELSLLDILDPRRICYDSLRSSQNSQYGPLATDWSHGNAIVFDESDDSYIVSLRHQDAVVKIGRKTKELIWILGDPGRWVSPWSEKLLVEDLSMPFEWSYHQHAPEITARGTLLIFDNGNNRAIPPAKALPFEASYSRAVEYRIDPVRRRVEQVWAYGGMFDPANSYYSLFVGDANQLPITGNVLVTDGGKRTGAQGQFFARIAEVTYEVPPRVVFEVLVGHLDRSYAVYRAERRPSLYPGF